MEKTILTQLEGFGDIRRVSDAVAALLDPQTIYLYNQRLGHDGEFVSFKLCVVGEFSDKLHAEQTLYREVDSEIPFDVLLYTPREWSELSVKPDAFANHILRTGTVIYG